MLKPDSTPVEQVLFSIQVYELNAHGKLAIAQWAIEDADNEKADKDLEQQTHLSLPKVKAQQLRALLNQLQTEKNAKLLAEPNLTTVVGREAWFNAGGEIPVMSKGASGEVELSYKQFGTSVKLVPRRPEQSRIELKLALSLSALKPGAENDAKPPHDRIVTFFSLEHEVTLQSGECLAISLPPRKSGPDEQEDQRAGLLLIEATIHED